jgi:hypothetical protein
VARNSMSIHPKRAAFLIAILLAFTFYAVVEPPWLRYAVLAAWICATTVVVRFSTAKRSPALQVTAAVLGIGFVAFVVVAQQSETGSDVLLVLAAVLGVGLITSVGRNVLVRTWSGRRA